MVPARYSPDGEIKKPEHGRLVLEIPLDDNINREEFLKVSEMLHVEWITALLSIHKLVNPDQLNLNIKSEDNSEDNT